MTSPTQSPLHSSPQPPLQPPLRSIRIVLVAPAGPLNVGSIARVMKNFGLSQLWLVDPQCDPQGEEALQMAVHAKDILFAARRVNSIPEALVGCSLAIATTARQRGFNAPLERPEIALPALLPQPVRDLASNSAPDPAPDPDLDPAPDSETALLFGPEDRGLSNEELSYAQRYIKIPSDPGYSALNLAQAVAVCAYELYRASQAPASLEAVAPSADLNNQQNDPKALRNSPLSGKQTESNSPNKAQLDELEGYYRHLERVLLQVEYLYPHTAASRMRKFRQLLHRADPTSVEVAALRGMLRQVEWALSAPKKDIRPDSQPDL
jgi:tRNA/rRNA methyltransferase